jgi:hypothetical protein
MENVRQACGTRLQPASSIKKAGLRISARPAELLLRHDNTCNYLLVATGALSLTKPD